jgi:hypothetical protein
VDNSQLLVAQALSLSGLIGAAGAYAGILRRRADARMVTRAAMDSSLVAVDRVDRSIALSRLERTFDKSVVRREDRRSTPRWL